MGRIRIEDFHGLYTWGGIRRRPQGSAFWLSNGSAEAPGVIRSRVGRGRSTNGSSSSILSVHPLSTSSDGTSVAVQCYDGKLRAYDGSGTVSILDNTFTGATHFWTGFRSFSARGLANHYLTSTYGAKRYDSSTVEFAGQARAQVYRRAGRTGNQLAAGTGILAAGSSRAYRFTIYKLDNSGAEISGPPSARLVIRNLTGSGGYTGGALDPVPYCLISNQLGGTTALTTSFYIRTWASRTSTGEPDDEMFLIDEHQITSTDISNGYYGFQDGYSDTLVSTGARLHTNVNDYQPPEPILTKGVVNEDAHPPLTEDVASWRGRMWYGGLLREWPSRVIVMLVNPANNDAITINGQAITFKTGALGALTDSKVETGYASATNNLEATACNLVDAININRATTGVVASYISGPGAFPGQILLEAITYAGATTVTSVSVAANWRIGNATVQQAYNLLAFSKEGRPDAVPPANRLTISVDSSLEVWRTVPLRDFLYIFTSQGVFRVSGDDATNFSVELHDSTAKIVGPQMIAVVDDRIYAWCTQGICAIDASGVEWISMPIEPTLKTITNTLSTTNPFSIAVQGFASPWQAAHRVCFWYPAAAYNTGSPLANLNCVSAVVYNTQTRKWSLESHQPATGFSCSSDSRISSPILGDTINPDGNGFLYTPNPGNALNDYRDTKRDGTYSNVVTGVWLAIQAPEGVSSPHWQEVAFAFERERNFLGGVLNPPSNLTVTFYSPDLQTTVVASPGTTDQPDYRRVIVPQGFQRAPELIVAVATDPTTAGGPLFMGLECVDIFYGEPARGTVRK